MSVLESNCPVNRIEPRNVRNKRRIHRAYETSQLKMRLSSDVKHNLDQLTFLKSNYKYKRRTGVRTMPQRVIGRDRTVAHTHWKCGRESESDKFSFRVILRLFLVIVGQLMHHRNGLATRRLPLTSVATSAASAATIAIGHGAVSGAVTAATASDASDASDADDASVADDDVNVDSAETNYQRNYDKVGTATATSRCQNAARCQHRANNRDGFRSRRFWPTAGHALIDLAPTTAAIHRPPMETGASRVNVLSILTTLFMALAFSVPSAEAGACWQTNLDNGKCNEIFSLNITKLECCGASQEFSYTDRELTSVEYFFATAIGGGMECVPCIESCRNVNCGIDKKCVKRKGRPKCICAPECGAAMRRRQRSEQFWKRTDHEHHSEHEQLTVGAGIFGKSPRDIRSLSSEITNVNLGIDGAQHQSPRSQRKVLVLQGDGVQKRAPTKTRRLLVAANVEQIEKPTTRRLQILSNVRIPPTNYGGRGVGQRPSVGDTPDNGASSSRRRLNANKPNKKHGRKRMDMGMAMTSGEHGSDNGGRVRHAHHPNSEEEKLHAPNHDQVVGKQRHHERHRQTHRKRKHDNRSWQHQQRRRQQLLLHHPLKKDANGNTTVPIPDVTTTESTTTTGTMSLTRQTAFASSTMSEFGHNSTTTTTTATTADSAQTTTTTPANSTLSAARSVLNRGSASATSSSSSSAAAAAAATTSLVGGGVSVDYAGGSNSVNSDDLTFLDGIYDKFNLHGFPNQQHTAAATHFENLHTNHPVCGTDGRTYNTECQLRKRACRTNNPTLQVAYRGHCKTTCNGIKCLNGLTCVEDHYTIPHCIVCKIECPQDKDNDVIDVSRAVCGVDGKTYRSTCAINRMICEIGRSIAVAYPGPCRDDRVTCSDINCGPKNTCLVDMLTHEPRCVSCRYKCARKRRPSSVRFEEGKICGVNNRTYNSWCEMRKDSCSTGFFIDVKSPGECT